MDKLSHIRAELPRLIEDIEERLDDCKSALDRLGPNRDSHDHQQQLFLLQISQEFQAVSKAALDGSYGHGFFGDPRTSEGYAKRLRAVVQNLNKDFAETVRLHGQKRRIVDHHTDTLNSPSDRMTISRADFIDEIKELLSVTRGRELPGMFNPLIVGDIFFVQSQPWEQLARQHLRDVWQATRSFLEFLVSHLADEKTSEASLGHVIDCHEPKAEQDEWKTTRVGDTLPERPSYYVQSLLHRNYSEGERETPRGRNRTKAPEISRSKGKRCSRKCKGKERKDA